MGVLVARPLMREGGKLYFIDYDGTKKEVRKPAPPPPPPPVKAAPEK